MLTPRGTVFTVAVAGAALVGFAANSVLCRMALAPGAIDAASFTAVRLASGAVTLAVLARMARREANDGPAGAHQGSWRGAAALFVYAAAFSFAYLRLDAGTGAFILFGAVQLSMIGWGVLRGERPRPREIAGGLVALVGLALLTRPGLTAPDPAAAGLMAGAGVAWGVYSLLGRAVRRPLASTAANFLRAVPLGVALAAVAIARAHLSWPGAGLAVASGALASGVGYSLWYAVVPRMSATRAALVQLLVPALAAGAGVLLLDERITPRLLISAAAITGGVALAVTARRRR